jgi:hypothetical protein
VPEQAAIHRSDTCRCSSFESPESLLAKPERSAIAAAARLIPAHEAAIEATGVISLPFGIVDAFAEIEPYYGVVRTVPLRLRFIAKRSERNGGHHGRA